MYALWNINRMLPFVCIAMQVHLMIWVRRYVLEEKAVAVSWKMILFRCDGQ